MFEGEDISKEQINEWQRHPCTEVLIGVLKRNLAQAENTIISGSIHATDECVGLRLSALGYQRQYIDNLLYQLRKDQS